MQHCMRHEGALAKASCSLVVRVQGSGVVARCGRAGGQYEHAHSQQRVQNRKGVQVDGISAQSFTAQQHTLQTPYLQWTPKKNDTHLASQGLTLSAPLITTVSHTVSRRVARMMPTKR